jgi:CheY-like chemotaxis protein/signal transduction histidine kinase
MNASVFARLNREPYQSGFITGFAALGSAATINIISGLTLGSATAPGVSGFLLATAVSVVAGTIAGLRSKRRQAELDEQIEVAEAFAGGDHYASIRKSQQDSSRILRALSAIAERQLQIDTNHARLMKDASLREEQLFAAIDSIDDEIAVYDKQNMLVVTNQAFTKYCNSLGAVIAPGMMQDEVLSALAKSAGAGMPLNEREAWFTVQNEMRSEATSSKNGVRLVRFRGKPAMFKVENHTGGNRVEIISDLSYIEELEERTAKAQREADAAARIKSVTLARLSHTIRTPMTGVISAAELLIGSNLDAVQKSRLDIIRRSAGTLLGVVQDMFDLAAGVTADEPVAEEPTIVATGDLEDNSEAKHRALVYGHDGAAKDIVTQVAARFNLELGWADSAQMAVEAARQMANSGSPVDFILVRDQSCRTELAGHFAAGLAANAPATLPTILVADGETEIDSVLKKALGAKSKNETSSLANISPASSLFDADIPDADVLIVDQDEVHQIVYANGLTNTPYRFLIAASGEKALEIIAKNMPRIILTDVSMLGIDGLEITRRIRSMQQSGHVKIIGMTNHYLSGDRVKCLSAGMDDYIEKPQTAAHLLEWVERWISTPNQGLQKTG